MRKKYLSWAALVIFAVVAIRPMFWLGSIGFPGLMLVLALAVGLLVTYLLSLKKGSWLQAISFGFLVVGMIAAVIFLKLSAPDLSSGEVKSVMKKIHSSGWYHVSSVEYRGEGIWRVRVISIQGADYRYYDERTGALEWED